MDDATARAYMRQNGLTAKDELIKIDVMPIINKIDEQMAQTNSPIIKETLEKIKKTFL